MIPSNIQQVKISSITSPTICALPFMHTYIKANGRLAACCESQDQPISDKNNTGLQDWNSAKYRELRMALVRGERPETCRKCWMNEQIGSKSARHDSWDYLASGRFGSSELSCSETGEVGSAPVFLELKCSNICNLKCKMCHPSSSSRLSEDRAIHEKFQPELHWPKEILKSEGTVDSLLGEGTGGLLRSLRVLQFSGGEPFYHKQHIEVLRRVVAGDASQVELRYSTNLTIMPGSELLALWSKFAQVNLKISIDGLGSVYEYIRLGGDFQSVMQNLGDVRALKLPNVAFGIGFTVQAYNIFQLNEFLRYIEGIDLPGWVTTHLLFEPKFLAINVFPIAVQKKLADDLESGPYAMRLKDIIQFLRAGHFDPLLWERFKQFTHAFEAKYPALEVPGWLRDVYSRA